MKKRKLWLSLWLLWAAFLVLCVIGILAVQQFLFFHPWHDQAAYEQLSREESFEEINIDHNGGRLNGWLKYNAEQTEAPLLIFFGGNSQVLSKRSCSKAYHMTHFFIAEQCLTQSMTICKREYEQKHQAFREECLVFCV